MEKALAKNEAVKGKIDVLKVCIECSIVECLWAADRTDPLFGSTSVICLNGLLVRVAEMAINGNKSNLLMVPLKGKNEITVVVTEMSVMETFN